MQYRTVTERIGERLGDIDWDYDFQQHSWGSRNGGHNPELIPAEVQKLRTMEEAFKNGRPVAVLMYETWERVVDVGMYDGWPYWRSHPSFCSLNWLGCSWHSFMDIRSVRIGN